jgi:hypothetical protein
VYEQFAEATDEWRRRRRRRRRRRTTSSCSVLHDECWDCWCEDGEGQYES